MIVVAGTVPGNDSSSASLPPLPARSSWDNMPPPNAYKTGHFSECLVSAIRLLRPAVNMRPTHFGQISFGTSAEATDVG